jgi:phosphorylase kinase alpha/beta subunit
MLEATQYHNMKDSGAWEENVEVHASSVGAIVGSLKALKDTYLSLEIDESLIAKGQCALDDLLPNESITKHTDLALLTLIYPFKVTTEYQTNKILKNVEKYLVRTNGVIRYIEDIYYNKANPKTYHDYGGLYERGLSIKGNEMEWTFGFAYLSIIYNQLGDKHKAKTYIDKIINPIDKETMYIPEGYYAGTNIPCPNNPLGWAVALTMISIMEYEQN